MASVKLAWIKKYGETEGIRRWNELNKGKGTVEWYIKKYGETEGKTRYYDKNKKLSISTETLKLSGKSDLEIEEIQRKHRNKSKQTIDNMIARHGEEEGIKRYNSYREKNKLTSTRRLEYWIDKCNGNVETAKIKLKEYQCRDFNWFVNKYGDIDGVERYYNINRKRGRTLENYVKKYGDTLGLLKYNEVCKKWKDGQKGIFNSIGQLEVEKYLSTIYKNVKGSRCDVGIILSENEKTVELTNNILYPDIIVNNRYIIEYNGDYWHANKTIFPDDNTIVGRINKPAGLIRKIDEQKLQIYTKRGFTVITIWDSEWQINKESIKNELKKIIK